MKKLFEILLIGLLIVSCKNDEKHNASASAIVFDATSKRIDSVLEANLSSGQLIRTDSFPSQHITPRPVDVWLPENYSREKTYAVLYMHDGQMLFDSTTSWNKQEWKVDEWATQLMETEEVQDFIVVAIHNIPKLRWQDLFPENAFAYMDEERKQNELKSASVNEVDTHLHGNEYLKFIVEDLKPHIDSQYQVFTDREHTFVMGSSMGGLMSMYAISEYPEVFGGAACLSTHWVGAMPREDNPYPDAIFKYMEANLPTAGQHKLYFDYGNKTLDKHYPQYAPRVNDILKSKGYTEADSQNIFFEHTDHSENSWNQRLDQPLTFLLGK